jgi:hypothetical protein
MFLILDLEKIFSIEFLAMCINGLTAFEAPSTKIQYFTCYRYQTTCYIYCDMTAESRNSGKNRCGKHVTAETDQRAIVKKQLKAVSSTRSVPRLHNEDFTGQKKKVR